MSFQREDRQVCFPHKDNGKRLCSWEFSLFPPVGEDVMEDEIKGRNKSDGERLPKDCRAAQQVQREREQQLEQCTQQVRSVKADAAHQPGTAVSGQASKRDGIVGKEIRQDRYFAGSDKGKGIMPLLMCGPGNLVVDQGKDDQVHHHRQATDDQIAEGALKPLRAPSRQPIDHGERSIPRSIASFDLTITAWAVHRLEPGAVEPGWCSIPESELDDRTGS